jgi:quinol monooxygenase YgiN
MITVEIHLTARRGKQTELIQVFGDLSRKISEESGCINCHFYQSPENNDELVVIEEWEDEPMARTHLESENLAILVGASAVLTQKVSVVSGNDISTKKLKQSFEERLVKLKTISCNQVERRNNE